MSGHAILDSCHNCGKRDVELRVVDTTPHSLGCGHLNEHGAKYHHFHVTAACVECRKKIWKQD